MSEQARLLVVDDEAPQLEALCTVLGEEGHAVVACATPDEALEALRQQRFDVMLSDLNMPRIDGIELMRQAIAIDPDMVPLLMTGQGSIPSAVEAMKVGALDYVLKPFRMSAIRPVLDRALAMHRLKADNRALQEAVAQRNAQLEAANQELDAFAARIAHDLRGPLLGMLGFARIVQERNVERLEPASVGYLQRIISSGERADRMTHDLLGFARLGNSPLTKRSVDLAELVRAARHNVEATACGRSVDWRIAPLPTVHGDASLLEQVFVNLLSNALKYTGKREQACIEVGAQACAQAGHRIWVRDNGVGFDPSYAARLFSPFQRLHRTEDFEGNGMGLANVRRIVERHGGTVSAESSPGQGATFSVWLPA
jgi:signal transduction histidine kinase